ncbi:MAG: O-antigen ligase family protein [bacterium]|nr:O-antigen ligase family protein [bacterium]
MFTTERGRAWLVLVSIVLFPLCFNPLRFDPYEPHRVGALLVLLAVGLPFLPLPSMDQRNRSGWFALLLWMAALIISSVLALSPSRAFMGDLLRRTGLLTHLLLIGGVFVGLMIDWRRDWRWFWLIGVISAFVAFGQAAGVLSTRFPERPPGIIGVPAFAGGWLALVIVCSGIGFAADSTPSLQRRLLLGVGLGLMFAALLLSGARGSLIAVGTGLITALLLWAAVRRVRWVSVAVLLLLFCTILGVGVLRQMNWDGTILSRLPLIARLNPALPDSSLRSRELIWENSREMIVNLPLLTSIKGVEDPFFTLRGLVGYGLEMFEFVHRPYVTSELRAHESGRPIDRAHNLWLDTWITTGLSGVLARAGLLLALCWISLKRSGLLPHIHLLWIGGGAVVGYGLSAATPYFALGVTFGGLAGLWIALCFDAWRQRPVSNVDWVAIIALAVLLANMVDLQFSFETIITGWTVWLAVGMLLRPEKSRELWLFPVVNNSKRVLWLTLAIAAFSLWMVDSTADTHLSRALTTSSADEAIAAAHIRPWDDRLLSAAANLLLRRTVPEGREQQLHQARALLERAAMLNPYDATTAYLLALVEGQGGLLNGETASTSTMRMDIYFEAATRLAPNEAYLWREWATYTLLLGGDTPAAESRVQRALALDPMDSAAQELFTEIEALLRNP